MFILQLIGDDQIIAVGETWIQVNKIAHLYADLNQIDREDLEIIYDPKIISTVSVLANSNVSNLVVAGTN